MLIDSGKKLMDHKKNKQSKKEADIIIVHDVIKENSYIKQPTHLSLHLYFLNQTHYENSFYYRS